MATVLKGESLAKEVLLKLEPQTQNKNLKLAVVLVGDSEVSKKYITEKQKAAEKLGIEFSLSVLRKEVSQEELEKKVEELANESSGGSWESKQAVLVGKGRLVGLPLSVWFLQKGVTPVVVDKSTPDIGEITKTADILISATGKAGLIKGDMVKEGAVVIDAGTSVESGVRKGAVVFEIVSRKVA